MRECKIAATLGPACREEDTLRSMIRAGAHDFRINFSQGTLPEHKRLWEALHRAAAAEGVWVRVMGDLCGPRFRSGALVSEGQIVEAGQEVAIAPGMAKGNASCFGTNYDHIQDDVALGDRIFIHEGRIRMRVIRKTTSAVFCYVEKGGQLNSYQSMNLPDTKISIPAMTENDWACVEWAIAHEVEALLLSFVRTSADVSLLQEGLAVRGGNQLVIAKIETLQATQALETIVAASDQVLIARGDLGAEIGLAHVPRVQQEITAMGGRLGKPVILATHILHSMIDRPEPTRAEVGDVAQAVWSGVNTLLLTGETAIGQYPVQTVERLHEIMSVACEYKY